jgi:hypothetical protein
VPCDKRERQWSGETVGTGPFEECDRDTVGLDGPHGPSLFLSGEERSEGGISPGGFERRHPSPLPPSRWVGPGLTGPEDRRTVRTSKADRGRPANRARLSCRGSRAVGPLVNPLPPWELVLSPLWNSFDAVNKFLGPLRNSFDSQNVFRGARNTGAIPPPLIVSEVANVFLVGRSIAL